MRTTTHKIIFLGIIFSLGVITGGIFQDTELHANSTQIQEETDFNNTNTLDVTTTFEAYAPVVDEVTIHIVDNLEGDTVGYADLEEDTIYIESGHSSRTTEAICDHEMTHVMYDYIHELPLEKSNDPIYLYSNQQDIIVCDMLVRQLERQS